MHPNSQSENATRIAPHSRVSAENKADQYPPIEAENRLDVDLLRKTFDGTQVETRDRLRELFSLPEMAQYPFSNREDERKTVLNWCQVMAREGIGAKLFPDGYAGDQDLASFFASFEMLAYHNLSLTIKFGVQYGLFGGSVMNLGTEKHHKKVLEKCNSMELPGCFAMTEIGHGSNVRQIETTATYNHETRSFAIHSPSWSAGKIYIGNAARDGEMATVFAQLHINGTCKGVHAFIVDIRDKKKNLLPGIHIDDNGQKIGLNGVDNGMIWFDQVTIDKDALLDRFATIDDKGVWSSPIEGDSKRFFTMLGTLVGGRMSVGGTAIKGAQKALAIATKYAHRRRQFGPEGKPETHIIQYPTHQKRIAKGIATTTALSFAIQDISDLHAKNKGQATRDIETTAAALKAYATWESMRILQNCREACGGEGYLWKNQIGEIKADLDIFTTFEGDNTVLMQLVAKGLFAKLKDRFQSGELSTSKIVLQRLKGKFRKIHIPGQRTNWHDLNIIGDLLLARENSITLSLAQRMRKERKQGRRSHDLMLEHQLELLDLAHAYAERISFQSILGRFLAFESEHNNEELHALLKTMAISFGLERILRNPAWFFNNGHLNAENHPFAELTLKHTYAKISHHSHDIVEAYGIPKSCMTAPIASE